MQINVVYDPSVNASNFSGGAPEMAQFENAISYVVNLYDSLFTNNVSFTIDVGWGEAGQQTSTNPNGPLFGNLIAANAVGENFPVYFPASATTNITYSYQQVVLALNASKGGDQVATETQAYATLPGSDPVGATFLVPAEEAQALGLGSSWTYAGDLVGFATNPNGGNWYFGTGTPGANQTDFVAVAEHEISEGMGRLASVGAGGNENILDLFRYTSPGVRDTTFVASGTSDTAYFSVDGGVTSGGTVNNDQTQLIYSPPASYDLGDWTPGNGPGAGRTGCLRAGQ
jgi:hypothetical protein